MIGPPDPGMRRWQEEVARDPGSPAFVPLADLYRAQGRLDIARRVCIRGLERHPNHVEGHYLLGRIHRDAEDPEKAYDEWDIALSLDPLHAASRRAIAFLCLERGDLSEAEKHLRRALANDPDDPRIRRAIRYIELGDRPRHQPAGYWDGVAALLLPRTESFVRGSQVRLALILDASGRVLSQHGFSRELDLAAFASLAAGVQAASREIARILGQKGFSQLYQGRGDHQIFLGSLPSPSGELLLLSVFGEETTIGLVRAVYRDLARELQAADWPAAAGADGAENLEAELAANLSRLERSIGAGSASRGR